MRSGSSDRLGVLRQPVRDNTPRRTVKHGFGHLCLMKLVLFDIDGTLTLTNEVDNRCYVCALGEALGTAEIDTD